MENLLIHSGFALALLAAPAVALAPSSTINLLSAATTTITGAMTAGRIALAGSSSTGDVSRMSVKADGTAAGTASRTLADRFADTFTPKNFGAVGDGRADDSAAINTLANKVRAKLAINNNSAIKIDLAGGNYRVNSSVNLTGIRGPGVKLDGGGGSIVCGMTGSICVDAFHTRYLRWRDLTVTTASGALPTVGIAWGQIDNTNVCDNIDQDGVFVLGNFSLAAGYVRNAETSRYGRPNWWNFAPNAYGLIVDGYNVFNVQSTFQPNTRTQFADTSNNENLFIAADVRTSGAGSVPIYMSDTTRHQWIRSYAAAVNGDTLVKIYSGTGGNPFLDLDIHFEPNTPTTGILFTGIAAQTLPGFRFQDQEPQVQTLFATDAGVTSVNMVGADIRVGNMNRAGAAVFGSVGKFSVSGVLSVYGGGTGVGYNLPDTQFSGVRTIGATLTHVGPGAIPAALTSALSSKIGLSGVTITDGGGYLIPTGGTAFPAITVAAPPTGGIQATAQVATMGLLGFGGGTTVKSGGSGYAVNDILTLSGGTFTQAAQLKVTAVSGGVITAVSGQTNGSYTVLPAENIAVTGGTGTGATFGNILWNVRSVSITNSDAYDTAPSLTFATGFFQARGTVSTFASALGLASGSGYVAVTGSGVALNYRPFPLQVGAIAVSDAGGYLFPSGGSTFPAITIDAAPSGGTQATASVGSVSLLGIKPGVAPSAAGSGYAVGDVLTLTGGTSSTVAQIRVIAVDASGAITAAQASQGGSYTALPAEPISVTGGTGSGAAFSQLLWSVGGVTVGNTGAYNTTPAVSFDAGFYTAKATAATAASPGSTGFAVTSTAATGGRSGALGIPFVTAGALVDGSGVRTALTTSGYTVPVNTSLVRFTQTNTIESATVILPPSPIADQPIQFVNQGVGAVTALTFSPAVQGWTNGSQLNAGPGVGLRIRWDTTVAAWFREQ